MCQNCGCPTEVSCDCTPANPCIDPCSTTVVCRFKIDTNCVIYNYANPNSPNYLQTLGLPNGTTLYTFMNAVDAYLATVVSPTFTGHSSSLVITPGGTHGFNPAIELVPSTDAGNALILGTDGHPFVSNDDIIYFAKTYAQVATLISTFSLVPGALYKITDKGDRGLFFTAVSTNQLSINGVRLMLCPAYYGIGSNTGNTWIGVWDASLTVAANNVAIWGGLVWKNLTGAIGSSINGMQLDATNWVLVPKASFSNNEYVQLQFSILYDFTNNWVLRQWDIHNNIFGSTEIANTNIPTIPGGTNPVDISDWNLANLSYYTMTNNDCFGIFNNLKVNQITTNTCKQGYIFGNTTNFTSGPTMTINGNICENGIYSNKAWTINDNIASSIHNNISSGSATIIDNNICPQGIYNNNIVSGINENYIPGTAAENGSIQGNTLNGGIYNNKNNGYIIGCFSSAPVNILYNINNGNIGSGNPSSPTTYVADVTDTIVNK